MREKRDPDPETLIPIPIPFSSVNPDPDSDSGIFFFLSRSRSRLHGIGIGIGAIPQGTRVKPVNNDAGHDGIQSLIQCVRTTPSLIIQAVTMVN